MIQAFYNQLVRPHKIMAKNGKNENRKGLSAKSVKNLHGVLHKALQQAVLCQYVKTNPCDACKLPRVEKAKTITPAPIVFDVLREEKRKQAQWKLRA